MDRAAAFKDRVDARLTDIVRTATHRFANISDTAADFFTPAEQFVSGGKRTRALLMYAGAAATGATGSDLSQSLVEAGAALELFQAAALVHDDIIDDSDTRRGRPAVHVQYADAGRRTPPHLRQALGKNAAILLGDLFIVLADQAAAHSWRERECAAHAPDIWAELTAEVAVGQYLDVVNSTLPVDELDPAAALAAALRVVRHKSGRYSVEHPLALGAALAGGSQRLVGSLRAIGLPLGEAFQLRDDDLGVFGDSSLTGKPAGDDLKEGKRTALIALTRRRASETQLAMLAEHFGDRQMPPHVVAQLRDVIESCGARAEHERLIADRLQASLTAVEDANLPHGVADELRELARSLAFRDA